MDVRCPACGTVNRVPESRAGEPARCGKCKAPLATGVGPVTVIDANFEAVVARASKPVLLDCWAAWCAPCRTLAPTIDALARAYAGRVIVGKLDVDASPATASRFGIRSIPTLLFFDGGRLVESLGGLQPRRAIEARLQAMLASR